MTYGEIKDLMRKMGVSVSRVAADCGFSAPYASEVLSGKRRNSEIQKMFARRLKVPVREIFPDYKPARKQSGG